MKRPGLAFSHVGIYVNDLARMEEFYTRLLEFTVTDRGALSGPAGPVSLVFLSRDPDEHHQIVLVSGRPERVDFNVINQISLKADSIATLRTMHARPVQSAAREIRPVTHGNALSVYALDPEGNRLELYLDLPWYVSQPIRVPVDFGLDDAALMTTLEQHARTLAGFMSRAQWRAQTARRMGVA